MLNYNRANRKEKVLIFALFLISISLFVWYLNQNLYLNFYDETGYIAISQSILDNGLFNIREELRTYLYPLLLSMVYSENLIVAKLIMSLFQYLVFICTILYIAITFYKITNKKIIFYTILILGIVNPYLIQACTLLLTDILASCFIGISVIMIINSNVNRLKILTMALALAYFAIMIRPSSAVFLPILYTVLIFRYIKFKDLNLLRAILISFFLSIIFIPQLYNNVVNFNHWTPLIHTDLYEFQSSNATQYLKYGTTVIPGEESRLIYHTPIEVKAGTTIFQLFYKDFFAFVLIYGSHIFGVFDWGYIDSYIKDFYPESRIWGSLLLYSSWFVIFVGLTRFFIDKKNYHIRYRWLISWLLIFSALYTAFIATSIIESRFGYPLFILLLPCAGIGIDYIYNEYLKRKKSLLYFIIVIFIFNGIFLSGSILMDYQTKRIDWIKATFNNSDFNKGKTMLNKIILNGNIDWEFSGDFNGFKVVQFSVEGLGDIPMDQNRIRITKVNGVLLYFDDSFLSADRFSHRYWESPKQMLLAISDKDTKWGNDFIPNTNEIQMYFKEKPYVLEY